MTPHPTGGGPQAREVAAALRSAGIREVHDSQLTRSLYSSDASLYRVEPQAVVHPRHRDELALVREVCAQLQVPLTMRGTGTSIAGNAVGPGVVVDVGRHLRNILEIDADSGTALVEPGVIQAQLQKAVTPLGWRFGPDPSTHNRATIGGMIGNNACGSRALGYGRTSDNVLGLEVLTGTGETLRLGALATEPQRSALVDQLRAETTASLATIRTEFGRFGRQVSGYSMEHLLPERKFDVARFLVGSEGTLAMTSTALLRLVRDLPVRVLVVLGYPTIAAAADDVPAVLAHRPVACEGLDARITQVITARGRSVPDLPRGSGWLMVELVGDDLTEVTARARALVADAAAVDAVVATDPAYAAALWRIREDGSGLVGRTAAGDPAHAGWEDTAVPPEQLGAYLREFEALLGEHRLQGVPYGHFGDGCVHIRIDFPLERADGAAVYRRFVQDAAEIVARRGGSMSGEHGDGRARSELLSIMYSADAIQLFERVKRVFDPQDLLNPGVIVRPAALDQAIRAHQSALTGHALLPLGFAYAHDRGDLSTAVHRCTGVAKCRVTHGGSVMCPSFMATGEEKDSTRGRARVLQDAVSGVLGPAGLRSEAVTEALDLCLSCKACSSDCPTGVDMATYKAEVLHQRYRRRLRPRTHYSLGWLPRWVRFATSASWIAASLNRLTAIGVVRPLASWTLGIDPRREPPTFETSTFRTEHRRRAKSDDRPAPHGEVLLFVDTFTDGFRAQIGHDAVRVIEAAGYRVVLPEERVCCGLTWVSTGQLDAARRQVTHTVRALVPHVARGAKIVGLEPSCTALLRSDAVELVNESDRAAAQAVADATRTLAELLLSTPGYTPPDLHSTRGIAQPHCHQHAVMGWDSDARLLELAGARIERLSGCCGLAGNFGVERGHYETSVAVAETHLLPALRQQDKTDVVLADGFSCRTQIESLSSARGLHLAQVLAMQIVTEEHIGVSGSKIK